MSSDTKSRSRLRRYGARASAVFAAASIATLGGMSAASAGTTAHAAPAVVAVHAAKAAPQKPAARDLAQAKTAHAAPVAKTALVVKQSAVARAAKIAASRPATSGYAVQQVNPTTYTNTLSTKVPEIPLRAGSWIIRTRTCTSVCFQVTSQGLGLDFETGRATLPTFNKTTGSGGTIYTTAGGGYCVHGTSSGPVIASNTAGLRLQQHCLAVENGLRWPSDQRRLRRLHGAARTRQ